MTPVGEGTGAESRDAPIVVRSLSKRFGPNEAVRGVSFTVDRSLIYGLIGPDGGGKTTIMRIIVSLLSFDSGEVLFEGREVRRDPDFVRSHVGYMPQRFSLYQDLTVEENLRFFGALFRVGRRKLEARIEELYAFSGLEQFGGRRARALSGGMKQKLALSCMLVHAPRVVVLDEPTFGVDPISRHELWVILKNLARAGTTILVSTAYMDEALQCDRVALVHRGSILAADSPERLKAHLGERLYLAAAEKPHLALEALAQSGLCRFCSLFGDGVHFSLAEGISATRVEELLASAGLTVARIRPIEPGLEELFLKLVGGGED